MKTARHWMPEARLFSKPLTVQESGELCAQIVEALHHEYKAGVVHRDFKPQNIEVEV
jgi:serine/threonine protein kinase